MDGRTDDTSRGAAKAALRDAMRTVWRATDVQSVERAVADRVLSLPAVAAATTVAAYDALPGEIPTDRLLAELSARGVRVLLPVLLDDDSLAWRERRDARLVDGRRGTRHPADDAAQVPLSEAAAVVVPGVAFDAAGRRLGRGGGSYDRALVEVADDALIVGVAIDEVVVDEVPTTPHDRPVHVVATPTRLLRPPAPGC